MSFESAPTQTPSSMAFETASTTHATATKFPCVDCSRAGAAASAIADARSNARANTCPALPLSLNENLNLTIINAQQLSDLRHEAVSTARDNAEIAHENHVLRERLREARVIGRAYYDAAQKFAGLERDWIAEIRSLLARLDRYGDLTEDEEVEVVAGVASTRGQHDQAVAAAEAQGLMVRTPDYVAAHGVGRTASAVVAGTRLNAAAADFKNVNGRTAGVVVDGDRYIKGIDTGGHVNGDNEVRREGNARMQLD